MSIDNRDLLVSIICNTYNQEAYIAKALDSFIMQKTDFQFEVLVHDDASTDSTADIVREYERRYPDLIKPIYETENQYSQKNGVIANLQYGRAKGKYIAFCEGDDYWLDENKLQKQVDFLEANPDYSVCVHAANEIAADTEEIIFKISISDVDRDMSVDEIILRWGENIATNSMMYRAKLREGYMDLFFAKAPVGDFPIMLYLSLNGKVRYMADCMSVHRNMVKGSWSSRFISGSNEAMRNIINLMESLAVLLDKTDEYGNFKYHDIIEKKKMMYNADIAAKAYKCGDMELYRQKSRLLSFKYKIISKAKIYAPRAVSKYVRIRDDMRAHSGIKPKYRS